MLRTFPGYISLPDPASVQFGGNGSKAMVAVGLNGTSRQKIAWIFRMSSAGTITKIGILTGAITTSQSIDVRLETLSVDLTGSPNLCAYPSGTLKGANTQATLASPSANTWHWLTLDASYPVATNEETAVVVQWTGTVGDLEIMAFIRKTSGAAGEGGSPNFILPFGRLYNGTIWPAPIWPANGTFVGTSILGLEFADGSKPFFGALVLSAINTVAIASNTNPDEIALRFRVPMSCSIVGMTWHGYNTANSDYQAILYDTDDTVLASISMNGNHVSITSGVDSNPQGTRCLFYLV